MFPEPREQAKAIGVYSFVASAGGSVGLLAGGVLTQSINWHWIFFVNLPIGIATAVLALRLIERDEGIGFGEGADILGAALITGALMLGVYTIVKPAADFGWGAGRTLAFGAGALALLVAFVVREGRARNPLIPLRIFRSRNVSGANAIQALFVAGMFGMFFLDALQIGLAFLPLTLVIGTLSLRYSERLVMRFGARATLLPGLVSIAAGLLLFSRVPVHSHYLVDILPVMLLLGAGAGLSFPSLMNLAMSSATRTDAGLASGLVNTTLQVGGALGLAILATLSATRSDNLHGAGQSQASALTGGYHLAFLVGAGLAVAAIVVAVTVLESETVAESDAERQPEAESGREFAFNPEPCSEAA
jgi:MFS family permease